MKRTALVRKTPLARGSSLKRSGRVNPRNAERRAKAFERNYGVRGEAVRAMACLEHGPACRGPVVAAHAIARGMGGAKGNRRHLVPLCQAAHLDAGEARTSQRAAFEARTGLDLFAEADRIAAELDARGLP